MTSASGYFHGLGRAGTESILKGHGIERVLAEDAELAANMKEALETYERTHDAQHLGACMDEQPVQAVRETRESLPATEDLPQRLEYEYGGGLHALRAAERVRQLVRRIEFCYTPKHRSWLNVAEWDLRAMTRRCRSECRMGALSELRTSIAAWSTVVSAS